MAWVQVLRPGQRSVLVVGNPALPLKGFDVAVAVLAAVNRVLPLDVTWVCQSQPTAATVPALVGSGLQLRLFVSPSQARPPEGQHLGFMAYGLVPALVGSGLLLRLSVSPSQARELSVHRRLPQHTRLPCFLAAARIAPTLHSCSPTLRGLGRVCPGSCRKLPGRAGCGLGRSGHPSFAAGGPAGAVQGPRRMPVHLALRGLGHARPGSCWKLSEADKRPCPLPEPPVPCRRRTCRRCAGATTRSCSPRATRPGACSSWKLLKML